MTASVAALPAHSREQEVKLLVDLVRLARVTILSAEPGAEKSELLRSEVMPLLSAAPPHGESEVFGVRCTEKVAVAGAQPLVTDAFEAEVRVLDAETAGTLER